MKKRFRLFMIPGLLLAVLSLLAATALTMAGTEAEMMAGPAEGIAISPKITPPPGPAGGAAMPIPPYPGAPACAAHDDRAFHLLWNDELGCHYDHEHGRPYPAWAAELFGPYTEYTGHEIGYAWETPNENGAKHPGYNFDGYDFRDQGCAGFDTAGGINAWFVQAHGMANEMGQLARVHSFWGAAHLCRPDGPAGVIVTGGHADFGQLHAPYKTTVVGSDVFPKAPPAYNMHAPPYVGLAPDAATFETWNSNITRGSAPFVDAHQLFRFAFRIHDPVGAWQTDGTFLPFGGNSSERHLYELQVDIPAALAGTDGLVNFKGFTDVHGNITPDCTSAGPNCVPLLIRDAIPGRYSVNAQRAGWMGLRDYYEGDIQFGDRPSGWIGPMN